MASERTSAKLFIGSDSLFKWTGARNAKTGDYLNSATVTARVYKQDKVTPVGPAVTLAYVSGSNGDYDGVMAAGDYTTPLVEGDDYSVNFHLTQGGVTDDRWLDVPAAYRGRK